MKKVNVIEHGIVRRGEGMFGYYGVIRLMGMLVESVKAPQDLHKMIESYGLVV